MNNIPLCWLLFASKMHSVIARARCKKMKGAAMKDLNWRGLTGFWACEISELVRIKGWGLTSASVMLPGLAYMGITWRMISHIWQPEGKMMERMLWDKRLTYAAPCSLQSSLKDFSRRYRSNSSILSESNWRKFPNRPGLSATSDITLAKVAGSEYRFHFRRMEIIIRDNAQMEIKPSSPCTM